MDEHYFVLWRCAFIWLDDCINHNPNHPHHIIRKMPLKEGSLTQRSFTFQMSEQSTSSPVGIQIPRSPSGVNSPPTAAERSISPSTPPNTPMSSSLSTKALSKSWFTEQFHRQMSTKEAVNSPSVEDDDVTTVQANHGPDQGWTQWSLSENIGTTGIILCLKYSLAKKYDQMFYLDS